MYELSTPKTFGQWYRRLVVEGDARTRGLAVEAGRTPAKDNESRQKFAAEFAVTLQQINPW